MKRTSFFVLGVIAGSVWSWVVLLLWGALNLSAGDSLFDRNPEILRLFISFWGSLCIVGGGMGLWLGGRTCQQ